jgi:hypothetical protein
LVRPALGESLSFTFVEWAIDRCWDPLVQSIENPLPNGLLNPRIDFVGLFLWWAKMVV